jgi:hypothetical protein
VFDNKMLKTISESKMNEVMGGWAKLHNEELHSFYSSPNIIQVIKSRRKKKGRHVACMGRREMHI